MLAVRPAYLHWERGQARYARSKYRQACITPSIPLTFDQWQCRIGQGQVHYSRMQCLDSINLTTIASPLSDGPPYRAHTSISLPVASKELSFVAHGDLSHGSFQISQSLDMDSEATVDVTVLYHQPEVLNNATMCRLRPSEGRWGFGVFVCYLHSLRDGFQVSNTPQLLDRHPIGPALSRNRSSKFTSMSASPLMPTPPSRWLSSSCAPTCRSTSTSYRTSQSRFISARSVSRPTREVSRLRCFPCPLPNCCDSLTKTL